MGLQVGVDIDKVAEMNLGIGTLNDYALLASGDGRKLERFGSVLLDRPCPQAIWPKLDSPDWKRARAVFERLEGGTGDWHDLSGQSLDAWGVDMSGLKLELRLTGFGNVGVFPEHFVHFDFMKTCLSNRDGARVLNLFAYTGSATLACARAGAHVTHVDAAKSVNRWAIANAAGSGIPKNKLRFIAEDAIKFAKRQRRKGETYDGIILDPPTFGRGSKGEVWKIERDLFPLLAVCKDLLSETPHFILLTSHSPGITPSVLSTILGDLDGTRESGEMLIEGDGPPLPAGAYSRWTP